VDPSARTIVFAREATGSLLQQLLPPPIVLVRNRAELNAAISTRSGVAFIDVDLLDQVDGATARLPIVAVLDCAPTEALAETVPLLISYPWLSHVVCSAMLQAPNAHKHLALFRERLAVGPELSLLGSDGIGRTALLTSSTRRHARFNRMREFFTNQGLSPRTIATLLEVAEELVMNALYDAPAEAGFFQPRPRVEDVELPLALACEISYGIEGATAFIRVRDPFGAFSRPRMTHVLARCNSKGVVLDESRGGAGLGLWRVFTVASNIAITVVPGSLTEFLVGIRLQSGRAVAKQFDACHLFFAPASEHYESLAIVPDEAQQLVDKSVTMVLVA
jgi:hypothetical protein